MDIAEANGILDRVFKGALTDHDAAALEHALTAGPVNPVVNPLDTPLGVLTVRVTPPRYGAGR